MEQTSMQPRQVLDELYALRAGMSVVSRLKDDADGVMARCGAECEGIYNKNNEEIIEICDSQNNGTVVQKGQWLTSSNLNNACDGKIRSLERDIQRSRKKIALSWIAAIILLAVALLFLFHFVMELISKDLFELFDWYYFDLLEEKFGRAGKIILILLWWVSLPGTIVAFIFFRWRCSAIKGFHSDIKRSKKQISAIRSGKNVAPIYGKDIINTFETGKKEAGVIILNAKKVYGALWQTFSRLIDERDWQYLDLVIFYFETGRALSLQEALQQVDREIQTQRIIQSIKQAEQHICNAIALAASRIEASLNRISTQLSTVMAGQSAQLSASRELVGAVNLSNALQAKSNVTSERLMNDVHDIYRYKL